MQNKTKYSGWLLAGLYNGLQKVSIPVFGVVSTMILAHGALTKEEMGVWSLFLVITSFVELIRQALVKTSLIKHMNHAGEEEQRYVLSAAFLINSIVTVVLIIIMIFLSSWLSDVLQAPGLKPMLYIFLGGMVLLIPFSHFEWILYSKSAFKGLFWVYFFRQGLGLLFMIIYLFFYEKISLEVLVVLFNAGILAGILVAYRYIQPYLTRTFVLKKDWLSRLWNFGKYVFGSGISTLVFTNASQLMLSPILGSTAYTASQGIANRVINLADIPSQVLSDILYPKSAKKENAENKERIKYFYEKTVGAALSINIPVILLVMIFPRLIILILGGYQYLDAVPYLRLIAITGLFLTFLKYFGVIIDSTGRPQVNFVVITIIALIHAGLTYFFIKNYGFIGAAYAAIISNVIGFVISQVILYRYFGVNFIKCFKYAIAFYPEMTRLFFDKIKGR
ncbi:MAG: oligosaccharide flippase family protein [Ferruginibacter sp.]